MRRIRIDLIVLCLLQLTYNNFALSPGMVTVPGGSFQMGDHAGWGGEDPKHPSDEVPIHEVTIDTFFIGKYEITNSEYCIFLNDAIKSSMIKVDKGVVFLKNGNDTLFKTRTATSYSGIVNEGSEFKVATNRERHPLVCVRWEGAAVYCNWLSKVNGKELCYDFSNWTCDFNKRGYRLPTEAEWEYAARGGQYETYQVFPWGNDENKDGRLANWANTGDPYEDGDYPHTTPVGFYDGTLHSKSEFNWPGAIEKYQTADGSNGYGLYDISGNVWELVNDWYRNRYYSESPNENPQGPTKDKASLVGDGKPYRCMRGGNWYNGHGGNDREFWGHGRIANRNPSHYRGPQDPYHPYYHIGFRIVLNEKNNTAVNDPNSQINNNGKKIVHFVYDKDEKSLFVNLKRAGTLGVSLFTMSGKMIYTDKLRVLPKGIHCIYQNSFHKVNGTEISSNMYILNMNFNNLTYSKIFGIQ